MTSLVLGIDLGAAGALALLSKDGGLVEVVDMPILRDGPKSRPTVNGPLLAAIIQGWAPKRAFVEYVGARPGEGPVGAFAFVRAARISAIVQSSAVEAAGGLGMTVIRESEAKS